ncbi:Mif2/CENP-C like-domain-containing protein [Mycena sp. CBHHK59/15]|nr:Mif2/CENP-C like-domain-containing protein [Mycena sp. CBHHK59/15]
MARTPSKPKPHIPYRGDDPSVGKKTGIRVARVQPTADGFEPFQDILHQANDRTPPRRKKKSIPRRVEDAEDDGDDDGEMSMDVDNASPVQYAATTPRRPASVRPVSRTANADFDDVPTPRVRTSVGRTAGPSRLAKSLTAQELLDEDEEEYDDGGNYDGNDFADEEEEEPVESPKSAKGKAVQSPKRAKGKAREEQEDHPTSSPKRTKGRGRARPPVDEEDEVEDDIARGMDDVEMAASDEEEVEEEHTPPKKKAKTKPAAAPKKAKPTATVTKLQKENRDIPAGVRRSQRVHYGPLEWWRLEKVVFGPREEGAPRLVPHIKEIVRIPKEPTVPLRGGSKKRKRSTPAPNTNVVERVVEVEKIVEVEVPAADPEAGWDDDTETQVVVKDYRTGADVTRRLVFTAKMFSPVGAANNAWFFQKIFGDGDFMAAGQLVIPVKGRKPSKGTKDNTYIFFVIEGAVNLVVNETNAVIASGGMFMVPRGNTYFIENIADREAKLFFTQARKMRDDEEDDAPPVPRAVSVAGGAPSKAVGVRRGVSANV